MNPVFNNFADELRRECETLDDYARRIERARGGNEDEEVAGIRLRSSMLRTTLDCLVKAMQAGTEPAKPDWRIGLSCSPKYRVHPLFYEHGKIVDVLPSGTGGHVDPAGVMKIEMGSGRVLLAPADEWQTA